MKGLGSSDTAANYTRALELAQLTEDTRALFEALSGLWTFHLVRAEHREAQALVHQLLGSARESKDDSHSAFAHFAAGNTAFWRGELESAAESLSRSIAACETGHHFHQVFVDDPTVYSRAYAAWTKHYQGLPDQALAALGDCLRIARTQAHPRTLRWPLNSRDTCMFSGESLIRSSKTPAHSSPWPASMDFPSIGRLPRYWQVAPRSSVDKRSLEWTRSGADSRTGKLSVQRLQFHGFLESSLTL
jgi:hypothetical protein